MPIDVWVNNDYHRLLTTYTSGEFMSDFTSEQEVKKWKRQYYDHLDLLDKKEKEWQALESILIQAVLRLSIAAEGQHASIDAHLRDIRSLVKGQINVIRLGNLLEDISALLLKVGSNQGDDKKLVSMLARLLEPIAFPDALNKQKNRLLKKLSNSSDEASGEIVDEMQSLLSDSIHRLDDGERAKQKPGFLKNLFGADESSSSDNKSDDASDCDAFIKAIARVAEALPWPGELEKEAGLVLKKMHAIDHLGDYREIDSHIESLVSLASEWKQIPVPERVNDAGGDLRIDSDDQCTDVTTDQPARSKLNADRSSVNEDDNEPSFQEILIRLLEQLMVSPDLLDEVDSLKRRIEDNSSDASWKQLLKDVAQLINTLRSRMQEEKQEFESFLQQITGRLKEMDSFLAIETASLNEAEQAGNTFDATVNAQVQDIHDDMNIAEDLDDLKVKVERRLNVVSDHLKQYRLDEQERYTNAQQNLDDMQSRMVLLERESGDLRKLILEKNRQAMFDALTGIPNRLSYEKKAAEEIARCKRFSSDLCMAIWDIDKFKQVNDTYGHKVGDRVLKVIAQLLNDRIRETDFIARYGGEEFVMFLPGADEAEALKLADALREKVSASKFKHNDEVIRITVSCGISRYIDGDGHESMFERADKALYGAKRNGRNLCLAASSSTE